MRPPDLQAVLPNLVPAPDTINPKDPVRKEGVEVRQVKPKFDSMTSVMEDASVDDEEQRAEYLRNYREFRKRQKKEGKE